MVGPNTTTTSDGRRIVELELTDRGELRLESDIPSVPVQTVVEEPGQYLVIRVGDTTASPEENSTLGAFARDPTRETMPDLVPEGES